MIIGNALLASQGVPALVITDSPADSQQGRSPGAIRPRVLRLLASTVLSDVAAVEFVSPPGEQLGPHDIVVRRSALLCTAPSDGPSSDCMVRLPGGGPMSAPDNVTWETVQSLYGGWTTLVDAGGGESRGADVVRGTTDWRQFWNQPLHSDAIVSERVGGTWCESLSSLMAHDVETEVGQVARPASDGQPSGSAPTACPLFRRASSTT